MKKLLLILQLSPLLSTAQNSLPRFVNDTLYTTSGYNIYKGQVLQLGTGTSDAGYFKFIKFHPTLVKTNTYSLQGATIRVSKLRNYKSGGTDENAIRILGTLTYKDGKKEETDIIMNFERAMENFAGLAPELTIPEGFKVRRVDNVITETKKSATAEEIKKQTTVDELKRLMVADEIKKLFTLYKEGALSKEEYEVQKKKLLDRQ